jgi:hypothetical protein
MLVSPLYCFPAVGWWQHAIAADSLLLDVHGHFEKMTDRNRYRIAGSGGAVLLTVPLEKGRNQRVAMKDVRIANNYQWQIQHWRTLVSVYGRSPYFEHYEPEIRRLFEDEFELLSDFSRSGIQWVAKQLGIELKMEESRTYVSKYADALDIRRQEIAAPGKEYYQVFADRTGFLPGMSILDLLFNEGPYTGGWLRGI